MSETKEIKATKEIKEPKESKEPTVLSENKNAALAYKGKPLVRKDNVICFGDAKTDKYILTLTVKESKKDEKGNDIASKVLILVQTSDGNIVKFGEKDSLYEAFEIGEIWLESLD